MNLEDYISLAYDAALETLLWSELDDDGSPFDSMFSDDDIQGETDVFLDQISAFVTDNWADLEDTAVPRKCGYDFVLTRNKHGAGFWDGGWGEARGDRLTASCRPYGEANLYTGDDGQLYLSA
jgi:hypothetical protein